MGDIYHHRFPLKCTVMHLGADKLFNINITLRVFLTSLSNKIVLSHAACIGAIIRNLDN